ncbi:MAG: hypothetical protein M1814_006164 [Vezdaea aestivalis]|nr:MAG: hypothetical protein M1814_006164 [Vezdaea aestivalis]
MIPLAVASSWGPPAPVRPKPSTSSEASRPQHKTSKSGRNRSILNSFSSTSERRNQNPWPQPIRRAKTEPPKLKPLPRIRLGYSNSSSNRRLKPGARNLVVSKASDGVNLKIKSTVTSVSSKHIQHLETIPEFNGIESRSSFASDIKIVTIEQFDSRPIHASSPILSDTESSKRYSRTETSSSHSSALDLSRPSTYDSMADGERPGFSQNGGSLGASQGDMGGLAPAPAPASRQTPPQVPGSGASASASTNLSGLVCNVHRTTGKDPHSLVGATTNILGDKLYVFGGRSLSRTSPQLTSNLHEFDLISRHWSKIDTRGDIPPARYFHSVCTLGDTKLVCYGGMSPVVAQAAQTITPAGGEESSPEVAVMSDIHIYDVPTRTWTYVNAVDSPKGRYAHCATILPSSGVWASSNAPLSALHHNPSTGANPNQGSIGVSIEGTGGAEMIVVGGQDSANRYIDQISVFNLRNLRWTNTSSLGKSCGAYRSVVSPLLGLPVSRIGQGTESRSKMNGASVNGEDVYSPPEKGIPMLIYSNYNFLDVKLELQIRAPDGTLSEKLMTGQFSPPGLRFPNGGVIDSHFVVSGTYLTSSKQEYALWALDLRSLTWSKIDAGGNVFSQGSWNRGILWHRRNTFVILGNRKRSLVDDYNHRRINFSHVCMIELEAFGLYDNPRRVSPMSAYVSASSPIPAPLLPSKPTAGGGRAHGAEAEALGRLALEFRELSDMDLLAVGGEKVPVNSRVISRRWGPYFNQLLQEGALAAQEAGDTATLRSDTATLRQGQAAGSLTSRNSSVTITSSIGGVSGMSGNTLHSNSSTAPPNTTHLITNGNTAPSTDPPDTRTLPPNTRLRTLYLPHTHLTLQALTHYLYTSSLPAISHPLCTPQILCSLLQLARPYMVDGLAEACVERLHQVLDGRNAVAVFNAAAMAAGGGQALAANLPNLPAGSQDPLHSSNDLAASSADQATAVGDQMRRMRIDNEPGQQRGRGEGSDDGDMSSAASTATSTATDESGRSDAEGNTAGDAVDREDVKWEGQLSAVVGLQKRGLRGLMEGRRLRERGRGAPNQSVGLGIA